MFTHARENCTDVMEAYEELEKEKGKWITDEDID